MKIGLKRISELQEQVEPVSKTRIENIEFRRSSSRFRLAPIRFITMENIVQLHFTINSEVRVASARFQTVDKKLFSPAGGE